MELMRSQDYIELVLDHGPNGNTENGRLPTYILEDRTVKISDQLTPEEVRRNTEAVENAGIPAPDTESHSVEIPIYGIGEVTVVEQERVDEPGPYVFLENDESQYINWLREMGHRAASAGLKLDFGLDNFGLHEGQPVFYDLQDYESVWHDEERPFHLMGSYLTRSIDYWGREEGLRAPETREMAENWHNI